MRSFLPSAWLLGAALYTVLTLYLTQPATDEWPLPPRVNETVVAKQPAKTARLIFPSEVLIEQAAATPAPDSGAVTRQGHEWVKVADFTTVGRLHPNVSSPVLFAYSVGRPLRVIGRQDGFVRVQDLGSGQLGWVKESALAPFTGGYRLREPVVPEPLVAAAEPEVATPAPKEVAVVTPVAAKKVVQPRNVPAVRPAKEDVTAAEPPARGLFRRKRGQVQHVALGGRDGGVAAIMQRAFSRF
jgi:hypothetical protein